MINEEQRQENAMMETGHLGVLSDFFGTLRCEPHGESSRRCERTRNKKIPHLITVSLLDETPQDPTEIDSAARQLAFSQYPSSQEGDHLQAIRDRGLNTVPGSRLFERFPPEVRGRDLRSITCSVCGSRSTKIKPCPGCLCDGEGQDLGRCPQCTDDHGRCRVCTDSSYNTENPIDESKYRKAVWNEEKIVRVCELKKEGRTESEIADDVGGVSGNQVKILWFQGQTDVLRFTSNLNRIKLRDCVERNGPNKGDLLDDYQQDRSLEGIAEPIREDRHRSKASKHKVDYRPRNPAILNVFDEPTDGGNFGFPDMITPGQRHKSGPGVRNAATPVLQRQLTIATFELFRNCMPVELLQSAAPERMQGLTRDDISEWDDMTHAEMQLLNRRIIYSLGWVHPEDMPDPDDPSGECIGFLDTDNPLQSSSDEKTELFFSLRDANYDLEQKRIDGEIEAAIEMVSAPWKNVRL